MNFALVLLVAACCAMVGVTAQTQDKSLIPLLTGQKCPIVSCGRNEILRPCGLCYHNTCNNQEVAICKKICYCGCYCKLGYVRVTANGPCILPKQCPTLEMADK